jgi:hypothetical protein
MLFCGEAAELFMGAVHPVNALKARLMMPPSLSC